MSLGEVIELRLSKHADREGDLDRVAELLRELAAAEPVIDHDAHVICLPVEGGASLLAEVVRRLDGAAGLFLLTAPETGSYKAKLR